METSITDRFKLYLADKDNWESLDKYYYYYSPFPEFTIKIFDDESVGDNPREFYSFAQYNESTSYDRILLYYHQTLIREFQSVVLDSGRMRTSTPEKGFTTDGNPGYSRKTYLYRYRIKGSFNELLDRFFINDPHPHSEESTARERFNKFIITFHDDQERELFEYYAEGRVDSFDKSEIERHTPCFPDYLGYAAEAYREQAEHALMLKRLALSFFEQEGIEDLYGQ